RQRRRPRRSQPDRRRRRGLRPPVVRDRRGPESGRELAAGGPGLQRLAGIRDERPRRGCRLLGAHHGPVAPAPAVPSPQPPPPPVLTPPHSRRRLLQRPPARAHPTPQPQAGAPEVTVATWPSAPTASVWGRGQDP